MTTSFGHPFVYNGFIYSVFFGGIALYTLIQLLLSWWGYKDKSRRHYKRKLWFHVLVLVYALFECIYAISLLLTRDYVRWGFVFHTIAAYVHVVLFGCTVNFWKQTLHDVHSTKTIGIILLCGNGAVTLATVIAIIRKWHHQLSSSYLILMIFLSMQ